MEKKRYFNLLKPVLPPKNLWDKVYDWMLGKARIVLLLAQLVIAVCFASKVIVDTQAKNKTKQIDRLIAEVKFYEPQKEPEYRQLQKKTADYVKLWSKSSNAQKVLDEIYKYINESTLEVSIKLEGTSLAIYGYENLDQLKTIENYIKTSDSFVAGSVRVRDLSLDQKEVLENRGKYYIEATLKDSSREDLNNNVQN